MPLTRDFQETIRDRAARDSKFRKESSAKASNAWLVAILPRENHPPRLHQRDVGFAEVAEATHIPSKSLMRMLGPTGNPRADIFSNVSFLQNREGVRFHVKAELA